MNEAAVKMVKEGGLQDAIEKEMGEFLIEVNDQLDDHEKVQFIVIVNDDVAAQEWIHVIHKHD